ncbi:MAG: cation:dicarboxylase symporter family transporter [Bacteroidetes bacterium]|nr:cation:dicarboxylase symporter family transporter [Bacteroidota bacterium]
MKLKLWWLKFARNEISFYLLKKIPQHTRILIGMLVGVTAGIIIRQFVTDADTIKQITSYVKPLGDIFMRMIFMMVIPLIISALALGVAELGDVSRLGKIGFRMVKYTLVVTSISVILGVGMVKIFQPGNGISIETRTKLLEQYKETTSGIKGNVEAVKGKSFMEIISQIVPKNPLEDMVRAFDPTYTGGGLLSVMFFALLIGIAMTSVDQARIQTFKSFLEGLYDIVMKIINYGMLLAPIGVGALLFNLTLTLGVSILGVILKYVLVVLFALALHQFGTYSIILKLGHHHPFSCPMFWG